MHFFIYIRCPCPGERCFFNDTDDPYISIIVSESLIAPTVAVNVGISADGYDDILNRIEEIGGGYASMVWSISAVSSLPEASMSVYNLNEYLGEPSESTECGVI